VAEALGREAGPTLCADFILFQIELNSQKLYKILKYIENRIKLGKYKINFFTIL
jgi:hypothetical protein